MVKFLKLLSHSLGVKDLADLEYQYRSLRATPRRGTTNAPRSGGCSSRFFPDRQGRVSLPTLSRGPGLPTLCIGERGAAILEKRKRATRRRTKNKMKALAPPHRYWARPPAPFCIFIPFPLRPVLHLAPSSPFGPSNRYCPSLRPSVISLHAHQPRYSFSPSRQPSSSFSSSIKRETPAFLLPSTPLAGHRHGRLLFLRFNTFLNERENKYLHLDWIKIPPSIGFTDFTGDARRRRLNFAFFFPRLFSL